MENQIIYRAENRGHADHGWLNTYHTFSFAQYFNKDRMGFGTLRVVNDDTVAPGMGFGTHPHQNMEIISIPTSGRLEHKDSMGNGGIIETGDIQVMSAGTGVQHSEFNPETDQKAKFFQIWVIPNKQNVRPRYQQITLAKADRENQWHQILSPNQDDKGVWIHQNAWFSLADVAENESLSYTLNDKENGVFLFVIEGQVRVHDTILNRRDALGFWHTSQFELTSQQDSQLLLMEVPMK